MGDCALASGTLISTALCLPCHHGRNNIRCVFLGAQGQRLSGCWGIHHTMVSSGPWLCQHGAVLPTCALAVAWRQHCWSLWKWVHRAVVLVGSQHLVPPGWRRTPRVLMQPAYAVLAQTGRWCLTFIHQRTYRLCLGTPLTTEGGRGGSGAAQGALAELASCGAMGHALGCSASLDALCMSAQATLQCLWGKVGSLPQARMQG